MRRKLWSTLGAAAAGMMGVLGGCDGPGEPGIGEPDYGVPVEDADGDGWDEAEDCDDADPEVHPEADEACDDGVDNDCDGAVDGDDVDCEEQERSLWAGLTRAAAQALGIWTGDSGGDVADYSGWVADYSGWVVDRDGDGWVLGEDPNDRDPLVTGADQR